jgi:hypothetical protein
MPRRRQWPVSRLPPSTKSYVPVRQPPKSPSRKAQASANSSFRASRPSAWWPAAPSITIRIFAVVLYQGRRAEQRAPFPVVHARASMDLKLEVLWPPPSRNKGSLTGEGNLGRTPLTRDLFTNHPFIPLFDDQGHSRGALGAQRTNYGFDGVQE